MYSLYGYTTVIYSQPRSRCKGIMLGGMYVYTNEGKAGKRRVVQ